MNHEKSKELANHAPKEWDAELGRLRVKEISVTDSGLHVMLRDTGDFPVDPDGYYFVNPPLQVRDPYRLRLAQPDAFSSIVTDAASYYASHPSVWGCTTTTVFSGTTDGRIRSFDTVYATARAGTGSKDANTNDPGDSTFSSLAGQDFNIEIASNYCIHQGFFQFDTSGIPDTDDISSAVFSVFGVLDQSDTNFVVRARIHDWGAGLTTADYVAGADTSGKTLVATWDIAASGWSTSAYNDFTSDAAFPANVSKTGTTYLVTNSSRMENGDTPARERVYGYWADKAGTTNDPKLVINHAAVVSTISWTVGQINIGF